MEALAWLPGITSWSQCCPPRNQDQQIQVIEQLKLYGVVGKLLFVYVCVCVYSTPGNVFHTQHSRFHNSSLFYTLDGLSKVLCHFNLYFILSKPDTENRKGKKG